MRRVAVALAVALVALLAGCAAPADEGRGSLYADEPGDEVMGLSAEEVADLRSGAGMGLARPAELNGYAGPLHVLELADELDLTPEQSAAVADLRERVLSDAVPLGEAIIAAFADLDDGFRDGTIDETTLREGLERIEALYAELRFVHLSAHLDTHEVLTQHQRVLYQELRGYGTPEGGHAGHAH